MGYVQNLFILRKYCPSDFDKILALYRDTVTFINAKDYSPAEIDAWLCAVNLEKWKTSLATHVTFVAVQNDTVIGFADLDGSYLDRLYVHKDFQNHGVATALFAALEEIAMQNGCSQMTVHSSITARPFFEKQGFQLLTPNIVKRSGVDLVNFLMKKSFAPDNFGD